MRGKLPRIKVVVPAYNCPDWIGRCLASIASQTYENFDVCVVDDGSSDLRHREIVERECGRHGWKALMSERTGSGIASLLRGVAALECDDEDVVIEVDGDDWLYNENSLEILADFYARENPLLTYGEQVAFRSCLVGPGRHVSRRVARRKKFRQEPFIYSHPRTFRYGLWRHIDEADFRDERGNFLRAGWDMPMMFAMLEMAGDRFRYLPAVLYVYNDINPLSDSRQRPEEQRDLGERSRRRRPYETLADLA